MVGTLEVLELLVVMTKAWLAMRVQQAWVMTVLQCMVVNRRQTHSSLLSLHGRVEVVLDRIVGPTRKVLCHFSPLGTHLVIEIHDAHVFFVSERGFVDWNVGYIRSGQGEYFVMNMQNVPRREEKVLYLLRGSRWLV